MSEIDNFENITRDVEHYPRCVDISTSETAVGDIRVFSLKSCFAHCYQILNKFEGNIEERLRIPAMYF